MKFSAAHIVCCTAVAVTVSTSDADSGTLDFSILERYPAMPFPASDMSVTVVDGSAYIVGGCAEDQVYVADFSTYACGGLDGGVTDVTFSYDLSDGRSTSLPAAPRPRYRHMAVAIDKEVYVLGGTDDTEAPIAEVDVFDTVNRQWRTETDLLMDIPVTDGAAFAVGDVIYVCGGYEHYVYNTYNTTQMFNVSRPQDGWTTAAPMGTPRGDFGIVPLTDATTGSFLAVGGWDGTDGLWESPLASTEVYDVATNTWTPGPSMILPRADKAIASLDGIVYVVAGEGASGVPVNDIEYHDASTSSVEFVQHPNELTIDRFRFSSIAYGSCMYLFGGQGYLEGGVYGDNSSYHSILDGVEAFCLPSDASDASDASTSMLGVDAGILSAVVVLATAIIA